MAVKVADCHAMTSYYEKQYKAKYDRAPNINKYSARWGFDSVLGGMTMSEAKELIDYYFTVPGSKNHDLDWFFWNYHKLSNAMQESAGDKQHVDKLLEESKRRAEEWRNSGKSSL